MRGSRMSRLNHKTSRRKTYIKQIQPEKPKKNITSLVLVENSPLKKKYLQNCKRSIKELEKAKIELERYNQVDRLEYEKWYNSVFGAKLTELRETHGKAAEMYHLLSEIEDYKFSNHTTYYEAYQAVIDRREHPEKYQNEKRSKSFFDDDDDGSDFFDDDDDDDDDSFEEDDFDDEYNDHKKNRDHSDEELTEEEIEELFEEFIQCNPEFKRLPPEMKRIMFEHFKSNFNVRSKTKTKEENDYRSVEKLKKIYRVLVRKLHPDYRKENNPRLDEIWHEVQIAYNQKDVERLELLLALSDIQQGKFSEISSVSQLIAIHEEYKKQLKVIRSQIRKAKKDVAWNFLSNPNKDKIKKEIQRDINSKLKEEATSLQQFEKILKSWSTPPVNTKSKKEKNVFQWILR